MPLPDVQGLLDRHGIMTTAQRVEIAEILLERPQHMSAEQIIDRLRDAGSNVSKATVYNSLKLFVEKGLVKELIVDPERRFYDSTTHAHHHFYNVDTGQLSDIDENEVRFADLPELPEGTECEGIELMIRIRSRQ